MSYRYETHCHTSQVSACSRVTGADLVHIYKKLNYTGIFITDHFFNGNTTVRDKSIPWQERVALFASGFEDAYAEGKKLGLDVMFAWEYSYRGTDYLTYGLDRKWLMDNRDVLEWSPNEYFDRVHADGGFIIHAHPMRQASYIPNICLFPDKVDGVEVDNSSMPDVTNERGNWFADSFGLLKTAGSDTHGTAGRKRFAGIDSEVRLETPLDYAEVIKSGSYSRFSLDIEGLGLDDVRA